MDKFPCRVMADLARHEADQRDAINDAFDETDEMIVGAVVPYELVEPVMALLQTRKAIELTEKSFGVDDARLKDEVKSDLDKLYRACVSRWRDL